MKFTEDFGELPNGCSFIIGMLPLSNGTVWHTLLHITPFSPAHIVYQENPDLADPRQGPVLSQGVFPSRTGGVGWQSPW